MAVFEQNCHNMKIEHRNQNFTFSCEINKRKVDKASQIRVVLDVSQRGDEISHKRSLRGIRQRRLKLVDHVARNKSFPAHMLVK